MDAKNIPSDLIEEILSTLEVQDVLSAAQTCTAWHEVATTSESLWRKLCTRHGVQRSPTRTSDNSEDVDSRIERLMKKALLAARKDKVKNFWLSTKFDHFEYKDYKNIDKKDTPFICEMTCNDWGDILDKQHLIQ